MTTLDVRMTNAKKIQTVVTRERKVFYSLCKLLLPIRFETVVTSLEKSRGNKPLLASETPQSALRDLINLTVSFMLVITQ